MRYLYYKNILRQKQLTANYHSYEAYPKLPQYTDLKVSVISDSGSANVSATCHVEGFLVNN